MKILGINGFQGSTELFKNTFNRTGVDRFRVLGHDAGAALIVDGELVAAAEEERFVRVRKVSELPKHAIQYCLRAAGLSWQDIDVIAFGWNFDGDIFADILSEEMLNSESNRDQLVSIKKLLSLYKDVISPGAVCRSLSSLFGEDVSDKVKFVPHHLAHLWCGLYISGIKEGAFLISDGRGEVLSSISGVLRGGIPEIIDELSIHRRYSLGMLYSKVTKYLGFIPNSDEYKVMGLSAFGKYKGPNLFLSKIIRTCRNGGYSLAFENKLKDTDDHKSLFENLFGLGNIRGKKDRHVLMSSISLQIQKATEFVVKRQIIALRKRCERGDLILEGGVALNCVNNSRLQEQRIFGDVKISFASSDVGVCIGAAAYILGRPATKPVHPYLGPDFSNEDIKAALNRFSRDWFIRELKWDDLIRILIKLLRKQGVIGWFQDRMEFGPRALGNRSILADPSFPDMKDIINEKVKHRETFRPFAPMVREEDAEEIFEMDGKVDSPYMTFVFKTRPQYRQRIISATHVDGTARIQTVSRQQNIKIHRLLTRFRSETDVPCLINTSFNIQGEPIVCSPTDALKCFAATAIDALVLGNFLIEKRHV